MPVSNSYLFGKESFETGNLPGRFDSLVNNYGTPTASIDTSSKINGANGLSISTTGETQGYYVKSLTATHDEIWLRFNLFIPSSWSFPTGDFLTIGGLLDASDNLLLEVKLENNGGNKRIILQGNTLSYTDTGLNVPVDGPVQLQIRFKVSATVGAADVWVNNTAEGSPDYASGNVNTGTANVKKLAIGVVYTPATAAALYWDDVIADDAFIAGGYPLVGQYAYGFFEEGTESGSVAIEPQDTDATIDVTSGNVVIQARYGLQELAGVGAYSTDDYQLMVQYNGDPAVVVNGASSYVQSYNSASLTDSGATTERLTGGTGSFIAGEISEDGLVDNLQVTANNYTEIVYSVVVISADLVDADSLGLYVYKNGVSLESYSPNQSSLIIVKSGGAPASAKSLSLLGVG